MAIHIADPEVSRQLTKLAKLEKTTKTEMLRRLLKKELDARDGHKKAQKFREYATRIVEEARRRGVKPQSKEESDWLWGMDQLDGN